MKTSTTLVLLVHLSLHTVDEGHAVDPSCKCIRYTSTYGKERGTFSSPDYPRPYSAHTACFIYTFIAAAHQIVEIIFTDFDVYKENLDCIRGDFVKVYSEVGVQGPGPPGINDYSMWSRVLCGSRGDTPHALYSHGPVLLLELNVGSKTSNATGFIGTFKFIDRKNFETDGVHVQDTWCDYVFDSQPNKSYGRLYSPRYPSSYPNNIRCNYHFKARKNERIKLDFEELFLQKGDESCLNRADVIKVYDGRSPVAPVLSILCNELVGYEILSTGQDLFVQFTANSNRPGQGFKARYQFQMEDTANADIDAIRGNVGESSSSFGPAVSAATSSCHQIFRSDKSKNGTFTSPKYPLSYTPNAQCHYDFLGRGRERVRLVFEDFNLQKITGHNIVDCDSVDSIEIFLYVDGRLEKMVSLCGDDLPKPIMSNGPKLSMVFRGIHSTGSNRGFKISYSFPSDYAIKSGKQLVELPCAFVFNSSEIGRGVITSPNYPGIYPRDTECNYFFYGNRDERVRLHFTQFDIEGVIPCKAVSASDYIQFSSQMVDVDSPRYCGQLAELHFTSKNNFLKLTFKSNDRLDATGFRANYIFLRDSEMHSMTMPEYADNGAASSTFSSLMWQMYFVQLMNIYAFRI